MIMKTDETKAGMERLYTALRTGDRDALMALFTPDAEWQQPASVPDWSCVGRENVVDQLGRGVVRRMFKPGTFRLTVRRLVVEDNVAVAQQAASAETLDGQDYKMEYCWIYTWQNGQITHIQEYLDTYAASKIFRWDGEPKHDETAMEQTHD